MSNVIDFWKIEESQWLHLRYEAELVLRRNGLSFEPFYVDLFIKCALYKKGNNNFPKSIHHYMLQKFHYNKLVDEFLEEKLLP